MPEFDAALGLDPATLIAAGAALAVLLCATSAAYLVIWLRYGARAQLRRRVLRVTGRMEAGGDVREIRSPRRPLKDRVRDLEARRGRSRTAALRRLLREAGLEISSTRFQLLSAAVGAAGAGVALASGLPAFAAIPLGIALWLGAPRWLLRHLGRRRRKAFTTHFPSALDVIVRGIQAGLPVEECFAVIAQESPGPVGHEFRLVVESQRLGLSLEAALQRAYERVPTAEMKFFATVLAIQRQTGGTLAETLSNLSAVLRDRARMTSKVRALSSEARASATIIGALPLLITALLSFVNPDYISLLVSDPIGYLLAAVGLLAMAMGTLVMRRMVNFEV